MFFVCREHDGNLCKLIEEQSFSVSRLPVPEAGTQGEDVLAHLFWLGTTWQEDAEQTRVVIAALGIKPDWLVVDHGSVWCEHISRLARDSQCAIDAPGNY